MSAATIELTIKCVANYLNTETLARRYTLKPNNKCPVEPFEILVADQSLFRTMLSIHNSL